ncbi:ATP-binding protein [Halobacillus naozhouensis]|uniref:AAA family ATPase n=1 Tax=Halobacillus naozhouensis TaxID=554880 RepID=A0ABY8J3A8_9BACI|nr:AAA family ATPase [Halobacillus naozhouensis]WFT76069.1 AAA family ATPase [Halobacillus naozhouensis]
MRIQDLHIYGFGKWRDYSMTLPAGDLVVIAGDNEAGKSTIRTFILFVLFGLPPKKRANYQPKRGGLVGGKLTLQSEEFGEVTVERVHDRNQGAAVCRLANGEERDERFLRKITAHMSQAAYQSIYSFDAEDLTELHGLNGEELGEVLISVGLTGSDLIYQTDKRLEKELDSRFKPKGKKPNLNQQLDSLNEADKQRLASEREVGQYEQLLEEQRELTIGRKEIEAQLHQLRLKRSSLQQLKKVLPVVQEYHQLARKLKQDPHSYFPENGTERMHQLQEKLLPLESEQQFIKAKHLEAKQSQADFQTIPSTTLNEAIAVAETKSLFYQTEQDIVRLQSSIETWEQRIQLELNELNLGMEEPDFREFDFPFYIEETWRSIKHEADRINEEAAAIDKELGSLAAQKQRLENQMESLEREQPDDEQVAACQQIVHSYVPSTSEERGDWASSLQQKQAASRRSFIASIAALAVGTAAAWATSSFPLLLGGLIMSGICATAGLYFRQTARNFEQMLATIGQHHTPRISESDYLHAKEVMERYERTRGEYAHIKERWKQLNHESLLIHEKQHHVSERKKRLSTQMTEQTTMYPFLSSLKPTHWEQLFQLLKQTKEKQKDVKELKEELRAVQQKKQGLEQDIKAFFTAMNCDGVNPNMAENYRQLEEWIQRQQASMSENKRLQEEIEGLEKDLEDLDHQIAPFTTEKTGLLEKASAQDLDAFYEKAHAAARKREQLQRKEQLIVQIEGVLNKHDQEQFKIWEEAKDPSELEVELEETDRELQTAAEEQNTLIQDIAARKNRLELLESSEEHSKYMHQLANQREVFQEQAKEWAVYQMASQILKATKTRYQENHLPAVIKRAEEFFRRLTFEKYGRLFIDPEAGGLTVEDQWGHVYKTGELSRGTADQLYVALRLALGDSMSETIQAPFIVDDAFVHFDEERREVMMDLLASLAHGNQIILFTYQKQLAEKWHGSFLPSKRYI